MHACELHASSLYKALHQRCADLKELVNLLPLFVAVTGKAWSAQPLKCKLADQKAVIVEVPKPWTSFMLQILRQHQLQLNVLPAAVQRDKTFKS